jgi:hypothetical protein
MSQPHWQDILVALVFFTTSVIALITYGVFAFAVLSSKKLRKKSYYKLVLALAFCDCIILCLFAFYATPVTIGANIGGVAVNSVMGALANFSWFSNLIIIAEIVFNRYICVCKHTKSVIFFSSKNTKMMIFFAFGYGLLVAAPSLHDCC